MSGTLRSIQNITTTHVIKYYQIKVKIKKAMQYYNESTIDGYNDQINKFEKEQTNLMKHLRAFKKNLNYLVPMK